MKAKNELTESQLALNELFSEDNKIEENNNFKSIELIHGECINSMKNIPDKSVDLICCDLPYGTTDTHGKKKKSGNRFLQWDNVIPMEELWQQYRRILKDKGTICLTADQPFTSMLVMSNLDWFKYEFIWKKNRTTGFLHANYRPMKQTEDILVFSPAGAASASAKIGNCMTYNPQDLVEKKVVKKNNKKRLGKFLLNEEFMGKNNALLGETEYTQEFTNYPKEIIEFDVDTDTIHPTQKPLKLMEYLIRTYSNEGDIILDNCMGSGTTGVACFNTGRKFIGIELDENYFNLAKDRIDKCK